MGILKETGLSQLWQKFVEKLDKKADKADLLKLRDSVSHENLLLFSDFFLTADNASARWTSTGTSSFTLDIGAVMTTGATLTTTLDIGLIEVGDAVTGAVELSDGSVVCFNASIAQETTRGYELLLGRGQNDYVNIKLTTNGSSNTTYSFIITALQDVTVKRAALWKGFFSKDSLPRFGLGASANMENYLWDKMAVAIREGVNSLA